MNNFHTGHMCEQIDNDILIQQKYKKNKNIKKIKIKIHKDLVF
jgi:hypothetical protein